MIVLPIVIPWLLAVGLAPLDGQRRWVGWIGVAGLAACFAAGLWLAANVLASGPVEIVTGGWPVGVGIRLRADALGVLFAVLSTGALLAALAYEVSGGVHERTLPALVLFLAAGLNGLFLTGDAFNFYVFFEISMTSAFVLASYGKQAPQLRAALTFTVLNLLGSVLFLAGIVGLYHVTGTLDMREIASEIDTVDPSSVILIAAIFFVAFGVKLGLFPFHVWVPTVYRDTWPAVAAILSGALANIGSYGLLRFGADLLPREVELGAPVLLAFGAASILYGAYQAVAARTASEVLAYSSISQAGYILVAIAVGGPVGYAAAILYALVNPVNKVLLFLATGLRGWQVSLAFAVGAFSTVGVPPAVGFFGKAALFRTGVLENNLLLIAVVFLGGAISFVYMFQIYQRDFWARRAEGVSNQRTGRLLVVLLAGIVVASGIWPQPLLAVSRQAAEVLAQRLP